jgi:hypothetical protein
MHILQQPVAKTYPQADPSKAPVTCAKCLNDFEDWSVVVPHYPEHFFQPSQSSFISSLHPTELVARHFFTSLNTHNFVGCHDIYDETYRCIFSKFFLEKV